MSIICLFYQQRSQHSTWRYQQQQQNLEQFNSSLPPVTNVRVGRSAEVGRMRNQTRQIGQGSSASSADGSPEFF
ncbi:hypothetical protein GPALN_012316 [Globodera pallida]|nr:hypothetical protein GPALN_012316 [Globodera pallida]